MHWTKVLIKDLFFTPLFFIINKPQKLIDKDLASIIITVSNENFAYKNFENNEINCTKIYKLNKIREEGNARKLGSGDSANHTDRIHYL